MELYVPLHKSIHVLNFGKLVKKPVQVHGSNGKTFTRMQWVSPEDASTGHGVRKISSENDMKTAFKHNMHEHPDFYDSLKDQGVKLADHHDFKKHPHFYLPETKESSKMAAHDKLESHHPHGHKVDPDLWENVKVDAQKDSPDQSDDTDHAHIQMADDPIVKELSDGMLQHAMGSENNGIGDKLDAMSSYLSSMKDDIEDMIMPHITSNTDTDAHIKKVQLRNMKLMQVDEFGYLMAHPTIAHNAVDHLLGKENAKACRELMKGANLTINCPPDVVDIISRKGYKCSDLETYAKQNLSDIHYEQFRNIMDKDLSNQEYIEQFKKHTPSRGTAAITWRAIADRARAELHKVGVGVKERKPTYIAFNPQGDSNGGAKYYGDAHFIVDPSILPQCTVTTEDSFAEDCSHAPKIFDMEHLKDMFLLRSLKESGHLISPVNKDNWLSTDHGTSDIKMELQYHHEEIPTGKLKLGNRGE